MDIYVPKFKDYFINRPIASPVQRMQGRVRMVLYNSDGSVAQDTGWFSNLITDLGLTQMGAGSDWKNYCVLGSNNTAPANSDTALLGYLGTAEFQAQDSQSIEPAAPNYEVGLTYVSRFEAGENTGTIREVGFGPNSNNSSLSIRTLVSPEIVKGATQVLDVYHEVVSWPELTDRTGTVTIDGTSYDYIVRGMNLNDTGGISNINPGAQQGLANNNLTHLATANEIGTVEGEPTQGGLGNPFSDSALTNLGNGSGYRDQRVSWGLDAMTGNVRSFSLRNGISLAGGNTRGWQIRIGQTVGDAAMTKLSTQIFHLDFRTTWARRP